MNIVLFFSYGYSIEDWAKNGHIDRESNYYNLLAENSIYTTFITYGNESDYKWQSIFHPRLKIVPVYTKLSYSKSKIINILKSALIPFIYREIFVKADILKTNQMSGSLVAVITKLIFGIPLVVRCGFEKYYNMYVTNSQDHERDHINSFWWNLKKQIHLKRIWFLSLISYRFANRIIITSKVQRDFILNKFFINKTKIDVIYNYIDTNLFINVVPQRERNNILFIGQLTLRKNIFSLLDAISDQSKYQLTLIGVGELKEKIDKYIIDNNINAEMVGLVSNNDLPDYLNKHSILVMPSHFEGNSKVCLEALSCGTNVICTDIPPNREIVKHNISGLLINNNSDSIRKSIDLLLNDIVLRNKLSLNGRTFIEENCSIEKALKMEKKIFIRVRL